jgi:hypothetical protein
MVRRHMKRKEPGWQRSVVISGVGATMTFVVALIVGISKFTKGAWVPIVVVPFIILLFKAIKRHYSTISAALEVEPDALPRAPERHTFVVLVSRVHKGVIAAVQHAHSLRPDHIVAVHVADDDTDHRQVELEWEQYGFDVPLEIIDSPYRQLVDPIERYLDQLDERWHTDRITVVIPEFVVGVRSISNLLHGQNGLALKLALLDRPNTAVLSVPFHVGGDDAAFAAPVDGKVRRTSSHEVLDKARLTARYGGQGGVAMADVPSRERVALEGEVISTRVVPRAGSPWLEVVISDGTATVVALFTGRRRIAGIDPGRGIRVDGVPFDQHGRTAMLNPTYTLLVASAH